MIIRPAKNMVHETKQHIVQVDQHPYADLVSSCPVGEHLQASITSEDTGRMRGTEHGAVLPVCASEIRAPQVCSCEVVIPAIYICVYNLLRF